MTTNESIETLRERIARSETTARAVAESADAVVVGSAIVNQIAKLGRDRQLANKVARFVAPMVRAV